MATSSKNWKKPNTEELELPSGNTALVKRPGMEQLIQMGVMPDSLGKIAQEAIVKAQNGPQDHKKSKADEAQMDAELMQKFLEQDNAMMDMFAAFDKTCAAVVVEPKVLYHMKQDLNGDGSPRKDVNNRDVWVEIPRDERITDDCDPAEERYSDDPPLYTDEVDSEDKQFIFQFVAGGTRDIESFRNADNDVVSPLGSD